jgi:hypothetical protein
VSRTLAGLVHGRAPDLTNAPRLKALEQQR